MVQPTPFSMSCALHTAAVELWAWHKIRSIWGIRIPSVLEAEVINTDIGLLGTPWCHDVFFVDHQWGDSMWLLQVVVILFFIPIPWEEFAGWTQCRTRPVADHWKTTVAARTSLLSCADHWCRLRGRPTHRSWGAVWCGPFDIAFTSRIYIKNLHQ